MQGMISDSLKGIIDLEPSDLSLTARCATNKTTFEGRLLKYSFGQNLVFRISVEFDDATSVIFDDPIRSVSINTGRRQKEFKLKNPQITLVNEIGNNYILIIEEACDDEQ
jgi:hypothetical protein